MLRSLVLILLIVNAAFFAWSQGWLNSVLGVQPDAQHEPQRMALQVHPDKIVVAHSAVSVDSATTAAPASTAASAPEPASASAPDVGQDSGSTPSPSQASEAAASTKVADPGVCIEAGPFSAAEYATVQATLKPLLPAGSWANQAVTIQGLWLVYMGPYADPDMLLRKQNELSHIKGLNFEEVRTPASLAQGLSLGRYTRLEDANTALNTLRNRGIRTARIVNVRPVMDVQIIRVAHAGTAAQKALSGLKLPQGKGFTACRP
jgi:cell division septation protein DedD